MQFLEEKKILHIFNVGKDLSLLKSNVAAGTSTLCMISHYDWKKATRLHTSLYAAHPPNSGIVSWKKICAPCIGVYSIVIHVCVHHIRAITPGANWGRLK